MSINCPSRLLSAAPSDTTISLGLNLPSSFMMCSSLCSPEKAAAQNSPVETSQNAAAPAPSARYTEPI